jgi:hypothetical protein
MFGTIRKHQTWLWAVIITLTIISFVIFFSPTNRAGGGRGGAGNYGSINGEPLSRDQIDAAERDVTLLYFFMSNGHWPDADAKARGFDVEREKYQWLLLLQKQEQFGIKVSSETAAQFARQMLTPFFKGNPVSAVQFVQQVLEPKGFQMGDFERFCRNYLGRQELMNTVGMSGKLLTPQEGKELYVREFQELNTEAVFFSASNYLASVTVTPQAVSQFYSNQLANYRIPDRVQVSYVKFAASNYLSQAQSELTNLTELVDTTMERMGTNYLRFGATTNEAKVKLREEILHDHAMTEAKRHAGIFAEPLLELEAGSAEDLAKAAKTNGLTVQVSAPFDDKEPPAGLEVGADFVRAAFSRTAREPFAGPVQGQDGYYVFAVYKKIPSEVPPLDQIRDRVVADYKHSQALQLARAAGQQSARTLTNSVAQGKSLDQAFTAAGLKPVPLPPFSLSTRTLPEVEEHLPLNQLKQMAFTTQPGKVSDFQPTRDGGLILAVKGKLPLEDAKIQADLPGFMRMERQRRQDEAFNLWFRQEAQKGLRDTPLGRPQQPPPNMAPKGQA